MTPIEQKMVAEIGALVTARLAEKRESFGTAMRPGMVNEIKHYVGMVNEIEGRSIGIADAIEELISFALATQRAALLVALSLEGGRVPDGTRPVVFLSAVLADLLKSYGRTLHGLDEPTDVQEFVGNHLTALADVSTLSGVTATHLFGQGWSKYCNDAMAEQLASAVEGVIASTQADEHFESADPDGAGMMLTCEFDNGETQDTGGPSQP